MPSSPVLLSIVAALALLGCETRGTSPPPSGNAPRSGAVPRGPAGSAPQPTPPAKTPLGPVEYDPAAAPAPGGFGIPECDALRTAVLRVESCKAIAETTRQSARRSWETMAQRFSALADKPQDAKAGPASSCTSSAETFAKIAAQAGC